MAERANFPPQLLHCEIFTLHINAKDLGKLSKANQILSQEALVCYDILNAVADVRVVFLCWKGLND